MTKREKIAILKKMRAHLKKHSINCFCWAYAVATRGEEHSDDETLRHVIALGLKPPSKPYSSDFWYPPADDQETRIRKIDELIKRLNK